MNLKDDDVVSAVALVVDAGEDATPAVDGQDQGVVADGGEPQDGAPPSA
jgi:hypothetical protein